MKKIALATSGRYPALTEDDQLLIPEFTGLGIESRPVIWDSTDAGWQEFDAIVIRSCWDYHKRLDDFLEWVGEMEKLGISMFNSPSLVRWNCDKSYLKDLAQQGVLC